MNAFTILSLRRQQQGRVKMARKERIAIVLMLRAYRAFPIIPSVSVKALACRNRSRCPELDRSPGMKLSQEAVK